jgi:hypothetical protein
MDQFGKPPPRLCADDLHDKLHARHRDKRICSGLLPVTRSFGWAARDDLAQSEDSACHLGIYLPSVF